MSNRTGKGEPAPRRKTETVVEWLRSIESTRKPRPDRNLAALLAAERALE